MKHEIEITRVIALLRFVAKPGNRGLSQHLIERMKKTAAERENCKVKTLQLCNFVKL